MNQPARPWRPAQHGAALLIAMLILTLVATVASAMVWHQQRAIEVEAAERARLQAVSMLTGSLDAASFFIRSLAATSAFVDGQGIGQSFKDIRLSSLLAADKDNNADSGLEAFFSGQISDAQDRYNLRSLVSSEGKLVVKEVEALRRLCQAVGLPIALAEQLATALAAAWFGQDDNGPIPPRRLEHLVWLGIDATTVDRLAPLVTVLHTPTPVNANNAKAEALVAAIDGLDLSNAQRIVRSRPKQGWRDLAAFRSQLPENVTAEENRVNVISRFFDVRGSVRLDDRRLDLRWLVESRGGGGNRDVVVLRREMTSQYEAPR